MGVDVEKYYAQEAKERQLSTLKQNQDKKLVSAVGTDPSQRGNKDQPIPDGNQYVEKVDLGRIPPKLLDQKLG